MPSPLSTNPDPSGGAPSSRFLAALGFVTPGTAMDDPGAGAGSGPTAVADPVAADSPQEAPSAPSAAPTSTPPAARPPRSVYPAPKFERRPDSASLPGESGATWRAASVAATTGSPASVPPFWLQDLGAKFGGVDRPSLDSTSFDTEPPPRAAPRPKQPTLLQVIDVVCPACRTGLSISRAHVGVEGACPNCEVPILATQAGPGGKVRIELTGKPVLAPAPAPPAPPAPRAPSPVSEAPVEEPVWSAPVQPFVESGRSAAAGSTIPETPVLFGGLETGQTPASPFAVAAEMPPEAPEVDPDPDPEPEPEPGPEAIYEENRGARTPDPLRVVIGGVLVMLTCIFLVLAYYTPQYGDFEAEPALPPPAQTEPELAAAVVTQPIPAIPVETKPEPEPEPVPAEAVTEEFVAAPIEVAASLAPQADFTEIEVIETPAPAALPADDDYVAPRRPPETLQERVDLATRSVNRFLAADTVEEKQRWILEPEKNGASLGEFYNFEPLTSALPPVVRHAKTETVGAGKLWISLFDVVIQATLPHRVCVVHQDDGAALIDFSLYRQLRENALHRYLNRSPGEGSPLAPEIFRVTLRRIAYGQTRRSVDSTLFRDPPLLFEIGLPFHDGTPAVVPVAIDSPVLSNLDLVGWDAPSHGVVELQWQPSETNPRKPVPTISRVVGWGLWEP